jgi:ppGpp synthetase/RelA/SpoT-type nucleotidyltranferase
VTDLDDARVRWLNDGPDFEKFGKLVEQRLRQALKVEGIYAVVTSRAKTMESLIKKLVRKSHHTYDTLPDKAGVRIVVRFLSEVAPAAAVVESVSLAKPADTKDKGTDVVGYLGTHLDVRLKIDDPAAGQYPSDKFCAEVQVHTRAQNLWADMSHSCSYKGLPSVSVSLHRRVNLLAGLLEVADNEFERINQDVSHLPDAGEYKLLQALENQYYKLSTRPGDLELSMEVIHALLPLYEPPPADWAEHFQTVFDKHKKALEALFAIEDPNLSPFLFQPEMLLILDRLLVDQYALREIWDQHFPYKELQRLAVKLGTSYE